MFNESIYAFHVFHVMNFLPHSSQKGEAWRGKHNIQKRKSSLVSTEREKSNQKLNLITCAKNKGLWLLRWKQMSTGKRFLIEFHRMDGRDRKSLKIVICDLRELGKLFGNLPSSTQWSDFGICFGQVWVQMWVGKNEFFGIKKCQEKQKCIFKL